MSKAAQWDLHRLKAPACSETELRWSRILNLSGPVPHARTNRRYPPGPGNTFWGQSSCTRLWLTGERSFGSAGDQVWGTHQPYAPEPGGDLLDVSGYQPAVCGRQCPHRACSVRSVLANERISTGYGRFQSGGFGEAPGLAPDNHERTAASSVSNQSFVRIRAARSVV